MVFRNELQADWGLGLVVEDQPESWILVFEHAGRKKFVKAKAAKLVPVELDADAIAVLRERLQGKGSPKPGGRVKRSPAGKTSPKGTAARFVTFEEQLGFFERLFVGGFEGERFVDEERGESGAKGKAGYKTAAIVLAREELSPARFRGATPAVLFESAKRVLGATNIVHPIEGPIPFGAIAEPDRAAVLAGLEQLLHGDGEYGLRLERFAWSVNLKDKAGKGKRVTWPLATVFGALHSPDEHACVKPTSFSAQGATLGLQVAASQPVTATGYRQFLEVARQTRQRLLDAGHRPRDLVDVYSFIWRTHAEKPA